MKSQDITKYKLPTTSGVYFFLTSKGRVLYIGKAGSLRDRVRSYFSRDIFVTRGPAIEQMIREARGIKFEKTDSVLEAVILEAELIKKYKPKYNVRDKDDKSFNYVVITDEDFPRVLLVRGRDLKLRSTNYVLQTSFGPFPQASVLKEAVHIVRKIFPFRDKCIPIAPRSGLGTRYPHARGCFNYQIGLCSGVCVGKISPKEYKKIVQSIILLFSGKKRSLIRLLEREMKTCAKAEDFEKAARVRNQIFSLKHLQDISLLKHQRFDSKTAKAEEGQFLERGGIKRIEAYDIAHTGGKGIVGALVVMDNGEFNKNEYRKFILRTVTNSNDPASLGEIVARRMSHKEWPYPNLIVVDGGKAQVNAVQKSVDKLYQGLALAVVGVVKDEHHRPKKIIGDQKIIQKCEKEILHANAEAHRFALMFHRKKMREKFF